MWTKSAISILLMFSPNHLGLNVACISMVSTIFGETVRKRDTEGGFNGYPGAKQIKTAKKVPDLKST